MTTPMTFDSELIVLWAFCALDLLVIFDHGGRWQEPDHRDKTAYPESPRGWLPIK